MSQPLLAACLIVKNEENNLPGCLDALKKFEPLLEEICVYDTGSTDRTVEIAENYGCRVERGYWDGDFGRARNASLAMTDAKWVMTVDADERVHGNKHALQDALRAGLNHGMTGYETLNVTVIHLDPEGRVQRSHPFPKFLRPRRTQFVNRLHEVPRRLDGESPVTTVIEPEVVRYLHFGYAMDGATEARASRNADSLGGDEEAWRGLSRAARADRVMQKGRTMSLAQDWDTALDLYRQARQLAPRTTVALAAGELITETLIALGRLDAAAASVTTLRAEGSDPEFCDWMTARILLKREDFDQALPLLRGLRNPIDVSYTQVQAQPIMHALLICTAKLGLIDEATAYCLQLWAGMGIDGYGSMLLTLASSHSPETTADLIRAADKGHLPALVNELRGLRQPGPAIADILEGRVSGEPAVKPGPSTRRVAGARGGSAFGL